MKIPIPQKIQAGFAVALAFLFLTGALAWWSARRNAETFREVDHSYEHLARLQDTLVNLLNAETGIRGFAISGEEAFLQPYQEGVSRVGQSFAAVKQLSQHHPALSPRLAALEQLVQEKINNMNEVVRLRRRGDATGALQLIASGRGKAMMDEIRKLVAVLEAEENQLLQQRTIRAQAWSRTTMTIVVLSGLLSLGLVGLAGVLVRRDFERRQRAEAERDRFFNLTPDLLCIAGTDGYFKRLNPAFEATLGWRLEELLSRPFLDLVHPDDRTAALRELENLAAGKPTPRFECRCRCKDGSWKWLSWRAVPQPDGTIYAVARDETDRKQAEEALRRSEQNLAITLNSIGDGVLTTDAEGRVTRLNPVAEKLTGWTQAEALGRPVGEVFHILNEETRAPAVVPVDKVLTSGEIHGLANHTVLIARDGSERPIADSAAPIREADGRMLGVVLVFRDVTAERKAEAAIRRMNAELEELVAQRTAEIRQQEQFNRLVLENLSEGVVACDAEGRLTLFNRAAREWHGADPRALPPEEWAAAYGLYEADGRTPLPTERIPLLRAFRGEQLHNVELSIVRDRMPSRFVLASGGPLVDEAGRKWGAVVVMRDITERRLQERLALRTQRLESLGALAAGVAHDLNNALAPIMMSVEMLRMRYPREATMLETVQACAQRAADMVRQLLTFAKGAKGERAPVLPGQLVRELERLMKGSFPKNIRLVVKCAPHLPMVVGDATQLHQVLLNLCVNARDAMPNGGTLTLEADSQEVDAAFASTVPDTKPGRYVVLRVQDTGTGIPPEILDRIFDPFFTTKGPDRGTGLGLSTVLGIVKGHGGFVQVYSKPGLGSTFAVYLPAARPGADTESAAKTALEFRGKGETILFVDDEPAVRDVACSVLQRLNFKPLTATDGADGLRQAVQHCTELSAVITDLHMPHMDGLALVRALRRILPDLPVVVTSGRMDDTLAAEFENLRVVRLDKPFTEVQLAEALKTALAPE